MSWEDLPLDKAKIAIIGTGAAARYVSYILGYDEGVSVAGFIGKELDGSTRQFCGQPILGDDTILPELPNREIHCAIIGIGNPQIRANLGQQCSVANLELGIALHPSAIISPAVQIGQGVVVEAGSVLSDNPIIGRNVWIGLAAMISHDTSIGENSSIGGRAAVGADVIIGEEVMVGMGAVIQSGKKVGSFSIVGSGANVVHDVPDYSVVVGNPAKVIKMRSAN